MPCEIQIRDTPRKQIKALPKNVQRRVLERISQLAKTPRVPGSIKLSGHPNLYRVRVGDYRILYEIHDQMLLVIVILVAHRRESYRDL